MAAKRARGGVRSKGGIPRTKARVHPPAFGKRTTTHTPSRAVSAGGVVVLVAVVVSGLGFWRGTLERFYLLRLTVAALLAVVVIVGLVTMKVLRMPVRLPNRSVLATVGTFAVCVLIATAVRGEFSEGLLGPYARYTGGLAYLSYCALFFCAASALDRATERRFALVVVGTLGVAVAYGLVQVAGLDPFDWSGYELSTRFSTFGQVNFASGWVATALPLALGLIADHRLDRRLRIAATLVGCGSLIFIVSTRSLQGPLAALVGAGFFVLVLLRTRHADAQSRRAWPWVTGGVLAALAILYVWRDPLTSQVSSGLRERRLLWSTALDMFSDAPLIGNGFGSFAAEFTRYRPAEHVVVAGSATADDPHSVPLNLLVSGGILLTAAYLAFVVVVALSLRRGLRNADASTRLILGGLGGAWVAYLAQSLVSFDVPALALMHFLVAGAIVGVAASVDGTTAEPRRRSGRHPLPIAAWAVPCIVVALVLWPISRPLRADAAAGRAAHAVRSGQPVAAREHLDRATRLAPWEATYWAATANLLQQSGLQQEALAAGERAALENPGAPQFALTVARLAEAAGDSRRAERFFRQAVRRDPQNHSTLTAAAEYFVRVGENREALSLLRRSVALEPDAPPAWLLLAGIEERLGHRERAHDAYLETLERMPTSEQAQAGAERTRTP